MSYVRVRRTSYVSEQQQQWQHIQEPCEISVMTNHLHNYLEDSFKARANAICEKAEAPSTQGQLAYQEC
jgi:hypothetical protein